MSINYFLSRWELQKEFTGQFRFLRNVIKRLYVNTELIDFLEQLVSSFQSSKQKKLVLLWSKKIILQTPRQPDPLHFEAFKDEYLREFDEIKGIQERHNPLDWIGAELECVNFLAEIEAQKSQREEILSPVSFNYQIPLDLYNSSKELLSAQELMSILGIGKTTLDRRRADGMPWFKNGKKLYFKRSEVIKYLESRRF